VQTPGGLTPNKKGEEEMKILRNSALIVVLAVVLVSVASPPTLARVPAEDFPQLVWQVWLNQSVDVVAPAYNLDCWDVPAFHSEEVSYKGYRVCFRFYEKLPGQWWLEEWRGQTGTPIAGLELE